MNDVGLIDGLDDPLWDEIDPECGTRNWLRLMAGVAVGPGRRSRGSFNLLNLDTVYPVTLYAIPYLVRLIKAGIQAPRLISLLGAIGTETLNRPGRLAGDIHAAVRAELPFLIGLIDDADSLVRCRAMEAVAAFGDREAVLPVLRERLETERDPFVRDELERACRWTERTDLEEEWDPPGLERHPGDTEQLLAEASAALTRVATGDADDDYCIRRDHANTVFICREMGEEARPVLPLLLDLLDEPIPEGESLQSWKANAAIAVWRITGDADRVLPVLADCLEHPWTTDGAVEGAGEMGPVARPLAEGIVRYLRRGIGYRTSPTIGALLEVCPDGNFPAGCTKAELLGMLITVIIEGDSHGSDTYAIVGDIGLHHAAPADRDRLYAFGHHEDLIAPAYVEASLAGDEQRQAAARKLLAAEARPADQK
ncbi:HEAT repeat domain-containing protein [Actinocorallia aurea]